MQTILISILTAAITTKIIATYYFKKIDGYVEKNVRNDSKKQWENSSYYFTQTSRKLWTRGLTIEKERKLQKKDILLILVSLILCSVFKATGKIIGDFEYSQTFMLLYLCLENVLEKEWER